MCSKYEELEAQVQQLRSLVSQQQTTICSGDANNENGDVPYQARVSPFPNASTHASPISLCHAHENASLFMDQAGVGQSEFANEFENHNINLRHPPSDAVIPHIPSCSSASLGVGSRSLEQVTVSQLDLEKLFNM